MPSLSIVIVALLPIKKKSLYNKKVWQQAYARGILWSYHVAHHPEAGGLMELWNGFLKFQG